MCVRVRDGTAGGSHVMVTLGSRTSQFRQLSILDSTVCWRPQEKENESSRYKRAETNDVCVCVNYQAMFAAHVLRDV